MEKINFEKFSEKKKPQNFVLKNFRSNFFNHHQEGSKE